MERDDRIDGHAPRHPTRQTAGRAGQTAGRAGRIGRTPRVGPVRRIGLLAVVGGLAVVAAGGLVGCGSEPAARTDRRAAAADATDPQSYVGRTTRAAIAEAEAAGVPWRITREDDEWFMVTMDFVANRMNFEIDDGVVTRATLG